MLLTVLSPAMKRGLVLATMALLMPATGSAQNVLNVSIHPLRFREIREAVSLYPLPIVEREIGACPFQQRVIAYGSAQFAGSQFAGSRVLSGGGGPDDGTKDCS